MDGTQNATERLLPCTISQKKRGGHIPLSHRAEEAANYLCKTQWGKTPGTVTRLPTIKVITAEVIVEQPEITMEELDNAIHRLTNRKSGGPDDTAVEMFKAMEKEAR